MTVVHFDEPVAHVDTDAAGEPTVVAHELPARRALPSALSVAEQLRAAYDANATCVVCEQPIGTVHEAAYITTRDRVVHRLVCFAIFLERGFRAGRLRAAAAPGVGGLSIWRLAIPPKLLAGNRAAFRHAALELLDHGAGHLILDATHTTSIDASGLGVFVSLRKTVAERNAGGRVILVGLTADLLELLKLTRLDELLEHAPTLSDAIARLKEPAHG